MLAAQTANTVYEDATVTAPVTEFLVERETTLSGLERENMVPRDMREVSAISVLSNTVKYMIARNELLRALVVVSLIKWCYKHDFTLVLPVGFETGTAVMPRKRNFSFFEPGIVTTKLEPRF